MRADAKHKANVAAECLLAMQGHTLGDDDTEDDLSDLARAYTGAIMVAEAMAEVKALHRDMIEFMKALSR